MKSHTASSSPTLSPNTQLLQAVGELLQQQKLTQDLVQATL